MKIKILYISLIAGVIAFTSWMLYAYDRAQTLSAQLTASGLLPSDLSSKSQSANLNGKILILYDIEHPNYPMLKVKRGHFQNNSTYLTFSLKGLQGNLFHYMQQTQTHSLKKQLDYYNPATDLLTAPFITLAILGESKLNLDIVVTGHKTAPNQITLNLIVYKDNKQKILFTTKLTPKYPHASLFDNLRAQKLALQLQQICPEWKQKLDDYSLSKNKPFAQEGNSYEFSFSEMK